MDAKKAQDIIIKEFNTTKDEAFAKVLKEAFRNEPLKLTAFHKTLPVFILTFIVPIILFMVFMFIFDINNFNSLPLAIFMSIIGFLVTSYFPVRDFFKWKKRLSGETLSEVLSRDFSKDGFHHFDNGNWSNFEKAILCLSGTQATSKSDILIWMRDAINNLDQSLLIEHYQKKIYSTDWKERFIARVALEKYEGKTEKNLLSQIKDKRKLSKYQKIIINEYYNTKDFEYAQLALFEGFGNEPLFLDTKDTLRFRILGSAMLSNLILQALIRFGSGLLTKNRFDIVIFGVLAIGGLLGLLIMLFIIRSRSNKNKLSSVMYQDKKKSKSGFKRPLIRDLEEAIAYLHKNKLERELGYRYYLESASNNLYNAGLTMFYMKDVIENLDNNLSPIDTYVDMCNSSYWRNRFEARHALYRYGGEAVLKIAQVYANEKNKSFKEELKWLTKNISRKTISKFSRNSHYYVCHKCMNRFMKQTINLGTLITVNYYGCKTCHQSSEYEYVKHNIIAILDDDVIERYIVHNETLLGNWSIHRKIFDFDSVEIISATDRDVEQFCIQVGNDTDEIRQPKYKNMECIVKCSLSPNSMKVLENTFGKVRVENLLPSS